MSWLEVPQELSSAAKFILANSQQHVWDDLVSADIVAAADYLNVRCRWMTEKVCSNCGTPNCREARMEECEVCGTDLSERRGQTKVEFVGVPTPDELRLGLAEKLNSLGLPNKMHAEYVAFDGTKLVVVSEVVLAEVLIRLLDQWQMPLLVLTTAEVTVNAKRLAAAYGSDLQVYNIIDFFPNRAFEPYIQAHRYLEGRKEIEALSRRGLAGSIGMDSSLQGKCPILRSCYSTFYATTPIHELVNEMAHCLTMVKAGTGLPKSFTLGGIVLDSWTTYVEYWTHMVLKLLLQDAWKLGKIAVELGHPNYSWPDGLFFTYSKNDQKFIMYMYDVTVGDTHLHEAEQAVSYIKTVESTLDQQPNYYFIITITAPSAERVNSVEKFWHGQGLRTQLVFITIEQLLYVLRSLNDALYPWEAVFSADLNLLLNRKDAEIANRGQYKSKMDLEVLDDREIAAWLAKVKRKIETGVYTNVTRVQEIVHGYVVQRFLYGDEL